jgi:lipopolysaccharide biosynthesis regulator YciM
MDFIFIMLALAGGFILGWFLNDTRGRRIETRKTELSAYVRGLDYLTQGKPDLAIAELKKATEINSDNIDAYIKLGNIYRERGALETAVRIHESIAIRPNISIDKIKEAQINLGLDYLKTKNHSRAIAAFKNVIAHDRTTKEAYRHLRQLYEEISNWEEAYKVEEQILKLEKSDDRRVLAHLQTEMGKTYLGNDNRQALRHFRNALRLDDGCIDAHISMGELFYQNGELEKAAEQWKRVIDINPKFLFMINDRLERVYYQMGRYDNLISIYRQVIGKNPGHVDAHIFLGDIFYKKGMIEETVEEYKAALEHNPLSKIARQHIGKLYCQQNMVPETLAEYQDVLKLFFEDKENYRCSRCKTTTSEFLWRCPSCKTWDSLEQVE